MADITHIDSHRGEDKQKALSNRQADAVHCLMLPLSKAILLLPNAAVAEIIDYIAPEALADAPDWVLGKITWRERSIPLISFEAASGGKVVAAAKTSRIAVLNTLNGNVRVPYIGLLTQAIPHLQPVREQLISEDDSSRAQRPFVACHANVDEVQVLIPDLDDLEKHIEALNVD